MRRSHLTSRSLSAVCMTAVAVGFVAGCGGGRVSATIEPPVTTARMNAAPAPPATTTRRSTTVLSPPVTTRRADPPTTGAGMAIGVVANVAGYGDARQRLVLKTGIKLIREDRGNYAVAWAHTHGINCIGIIFENADSPGTACDEIELDNEPYWQHVDPEAWARQSLAVARQLRARGIRKPILLPLLALADGSSDFDADGNYTYGGVTRSWVEWINRAAPAIWSYVDGFAVHPYATGVLPSGKVLDTVRAELDAIPAARHKPFWVTEIGWPTGPFANAAATSEVNQAEYLNLFIAAMRARGDVAAVVVYNLVDNAPAPYREPIDAYGLVQADGVAKPALAVVEASARASALALHASTARP